MTWTNGNKIFISTFLASDNIGIGIKPYLPDSISKNFFVTNKFHTYILRKIWTLKKHCMQVFRLGLCINYH